jgi:hypothetical protein
MKVNKMSINEKRLELLLEYLETLEKSDLPNDCENLLTENLAKKGSELWRCLTNIPNLFEELINNDDKNFYKFVKTQLRIHGYEIQTSLYIAYEKGKITDKEFDEMPSCLITKKGFFLIHK